VLDFIFLMHDDALPEGEAGDWGPYLERLRGLGVLQGGSAIGGGLCLRKSGPAPDVTGHLGGYIRVVAGSLDEARGLLPGNPVYEAGGTVEIRELPKG
jgi:hypothetical protein